MSGTRRPFIGLLVSVAAAVGSAVLQPAAAGAASPPVGNAQVVAHFNLAGGQQPENIALGSDGSAYLTFALARQVANVTRTGRVRIVAILPAPRAGAACPIVAARGFLAGIVRAADGTLYVNYCTGTADLQGIWRIRHGVAPTRIAALPATGLPNGLALDQHTGYLYATDSALGRIWRVRITGGRPIVWANGPALGRTTFVGVNGVKVHGNAVWATNLDQGTILRIPLRRDGSAGHVQTRATGLASIDDFGFTGRGDTLLAALNAANKVAIVYSNGAHRIVLSAADGLSTPTSVAVRGSTIYVPSAAYFTNKDPNLLVARFSR
jgi:hypothetical protein